MYHTFTFYVIHTLSCVLVCLRRKLHCTRNFIHMNLFVSFILRAISVFIKDGVLYAQEDSEHCFIHTVSAVRRCCLRCLSSSSASPGSSSLRLPGLSPPPTPPTLSPSWSVEPS